MAKTNKSITKRMRITRKGKIVRSGSNLNHFLAKKSSTKKMRNKRTRIVGSTEKGLIQSYKQH
jgi:ribosomal protein L35